ncbi:APC amino acid permease [Peniophora sp. CONT]|nr:APC amino acid permease [Peniophora sp. CONT]
MSVMDGSSMLKDERDLAQLGYKQELKREFKALDLFGLSLRIVPSVSAVLVYAIPNGGPVAMVWGWAASSFFIIFVALAIAELGSAMPTTGGIYYWTHRLSSPRCRNLSSWLAGYINAVAYIAGVAGVDYSCAVQILAAASIGSDLGFIPTTGQTYAVFIAIVLTHCLLVGSRTSLVATLQLVAIAVNLILFMVFIIGFPTATPPELKNSAAFAFGDFENFYLWPNGFAFILSFLAPTWTISGFDSSVHVSEEARNAKTAVPWAVVSAVVLSAVLGWALNVVIAFNMGSDLASILESPYGQPMATILLNSFGKRGALAIWSFVILAQYMIGVSILTVSSRQNFAFSRDGAFPMSRYIYALNIRSGSPIYSVWVSGFLAALLGLLAFAGPAAIGAIFSLAVIGQYVSDSIPIVARFWGGQHLTPGPFSLGRLSLPVAAVAVSWMWFMTIILLFPTTAQTNAQEMNYSVVVIGGVVAFALAYYYFPKYGGVHWFEGPVSNLEGNDQDSLADAQPSLVSAGDSTDADRKQG